MAQAHWQQPANHSRQSPILCICVFLVDSTVKSRSDEGLDVALLADKIGEEAPLLGRLISYQDWRTGGLADANLSLAGLDDLLR